MALAISAILLGIFVVNVVIGSMAGTAVLSIVQEMLVLYAASIAFVVAILKKERQAREKDREHHQKGG